jgi:hypothetical protein
MPAWLERLLGRFSRSEPRPVISVDGTGFNLTARRQTRVVPWRAIRRIAAFKQDRYTCDRIVLQVEADISGDPVVSLSEDCPGFAALFGPMEQELGINPAWYLEIMTPAFEPSPTVLYVRPDIASQHG